MNPNPRFSTLVGAAFLTLLVTSSVLVGCGAVDDDNNQPSIATIPDKTLNMGDEVSSEVHITDADLDDTHVLHASSDDRTVATVSVADRAVIIKGIAVGSANITVTATDGSSQDNAVSIAAVFKVTVNHPWEGTWILDTIDGESYSQLIERDEQIPSTLVTNNWTFNSDGTWNTELISTLTAAVGNLPVGSTLSITAEGTYSLSGSHFTIITDKAVSNVLGELDTGTTTGTWNREGDTLTVDYDGGSTYGFKKK